MEVREEVGEDTESNDESAVGGARLQSVGVVADCGVLEEDG